MDKVFLFFLFGCPVRASTHDDQNKKKDTLSIEITPLKGIKTHEKESVLLPCSI